jgi:hypothetical protein
MEYTELDLSLRLVEIWYDITWAFFMSTNVDGVAIAKRTDRHPPSTSSMASVSSGDSVMNKTVQEKMGLLRRELKTIQKNVDKAQFKEICDVSLTRNDDLYPGFKDALYIAKELLSNKMSPEALNELTIASVFQSIYYRFCDFLIYSSTGQSVTKMIVMPTRTSQAVYDICRQKFCRIMCDEASIVSEGLADLVSSSSSPTPPSSPQPSSPPQSPPQSPPPQPPQQSPPPQPPPPPAREAPPSPAFSLRKRTPYAISFPTTSSTTHSHCGVRFPVVEMSDDSDDSDNSTVSSLGDEF